jgi:putative zinc finger/helix-turn-helix YgiT family protein
MKDPMVTNKIVFCDECNCEKNSKVVERPATYTFKNETFEIIERALVCSECGADLYDEILDGQTMQTLTELYSERIGLSLEEIKSIREQYGFSMDLFSRILGWSKATIVRYETGKYIPTSSHMMILKNLKDKPELLDEFYKSNSHKFNEKEQEKIIQKLNYNDQTKVEKGLTEALNINYKLYEKTVSSGYVNFHLDKLINMILYFSNAGVLKTKLMKLLFYSDFLNYKRNLLSMSGMPYVKLPYGPVPKDHDLLLSTLEKNKFINIDYDFVNEYTIINIKSQTDFDESLFSPEEIQILEQVKEHFQGFGSRKISDFSHEEDGWKNTDDSEVISYDYALNLQLD